MNNFVPDEQVNFSINSNLTRDASISHDKSNFLIRKVRFITGTGDLLKRIRDKLLQTTEVVLAALFVKFATSTAQTKSEQGATDVIVYG